MTKEQEQANREQLHRLLDAVLDVNGFEGRQKEKTGNKPTVFFSLFGHVANCEVKVYKTGWAEGKHSDLWNDFYFDEPMQVDELIRQLQRLV